MYLCTEWIKFIFTDAFILNSAHTQINQELITSKIVLKDLKNVWTTEPENKDSMDDDFFYSRFF